MISTWKWDAAAKARDIAPAAPSYADPDETDAEHLVLAAYHLQSAGLQEQADELAKRAAGLFGQSDPDKLGVRRLGRAVTWWPDGTMSAKGVSVQGPPYELKLDEKAERAKAKAALKSFCELQCYGTFPSRQIACEAQGKKLSVPGFSPARTSQKILSVTQKWRPDLAPEVDLSLWAALKSIVQHDKSCKYLSRERSERTGRFSWFRKDALEETVQLAKACNRRRMETRITAPQPDGLSWTCPPDKHDPVFDGLRSAMSDCVENQWTAWYIADVACLSVQYAVDTAYMLHANRALAAAKDPELKAILGNLKAVDETEIPDDAWLNAALIAFNDARGDVDDDEYKACRNKLQDWLSTDAIRSAMVCEETAARKEGTP